MQAATASHDVDRATASHDVDPVTLALVQNRLDHIARQMGWVMVRTSRSPIFNQSSSPTATVRWSPRPTAFRSIPAAAASQSVRC